MFISFEGIDGSGKSSQMRMVYEFLRQNQVKVVQTSESSFTHEKWEKKIVDIIINNEINVQNKIILMNAIRKEHLEKIVFPHLKNGFIILCDRFIHSTIAYQGFLQKAGIEYVLKMHEILCDNFMPDLTFFIDSSPENAKSRMKSRVNLSKFDSIDINEVETVRQGFLQCENFKNFHKVNGNRDIDLVFGDIKLKLLEFI